MVPVNQMDEVKLTRNLRNDLKTASEGFTSDKIFLVFDKNTWRYCWPLVEGFSEIKESNIIILEPGESSKSITQVMQIWEKFGNLGIDRKSLIINIGGGMITDLGGFAASTLKRGLTFINVPTSLLAMVDASVRGKTGINFRGLKNEIGVIRMPLKVFLYPPFLSTLSKDEFLSGFAEMLKAALIGDADLWQQISRADISDMSDPRWEQWIWRSVEIKKDIVSQDMYETGARKALNFGHTIGHAMESDALQAGQHLLHGYAVAFGMVVESRISAMISGLPENQLKEIEDTLSVLYGQNPDLSKRAEDLIAWMRFDKKNSGNQIHFTLLPEIGRFEVNHTLSEPDIRAFLIKTGS